VGLKWCQSLRIGLGLWRWALFFFFFRRCLVLNIFPFPVSTEKIFGDFYNNKQSTANSFPRIAYFLLSLCRANTIGAAICTRAANIKKIRKNFVWALQIRPARLLAPNATQRQ
jgi:hypothetical protein